jgi:CRP-like cAMP-binding protein/1-acyl-sn-glycerol-3-phosphate acyltransferase
MLPSGDATVLTLERLVTAIWPEPLPAGFVDRWLELADSIQVEGGTRFLNQLHPGEEFFILAQGEIAYSLILAGSRESLILGRDAQPGLPLGWSALVAPHRYATSAHAVTDCQLYRWPIAPLADLLAQHPRVGAGLFAYVFARMQPLLDASRRALTTTPLAADMLRRSLVTVSKPSTQPDLPEEGRRRLLADSLMCEGFATEVLDTLAAGAQVRHVAAGQPLYRQGEPADQLMLLVAGMVEILCRNDDDGNQVFLRGYSTPGQVVAGSSFKALKEHRESAVAVCGTSVISIGRDLIEELCRTYPGFELQLEQRWLWLLSARLRTLRLHVVAQQQGNDGVVIQDLLGMVGPQLGVDSALYKLPHLLASRLTHAEAFACLDTLRADGSPLERALAGVLGELLAGLRREQRFFEGLNRVYRVVTESPADQPAADVRRAACIAFQQAFKHVRYVIKGEEYRPAESGHIFILNHLVSYPDYALANGFEFALDTHFVSSMILEPRYGDGGVRVVRRGRGEEHGHHRYYDRLGHIYVFTAESDARMEQAEDIAARRARFTASCGEFLAAGTNLIICPEGTSNRIEESPSAFKKGTFHLAAQLAREPLIVPIAVVNVDRSMKQHRIAASILPGVRISEVCDPADRDSLAGFLLGLRTNLRAELEATLLLAADS